jgi:hypothetical protein
MGSHSRTTYTERCDRCGREKQGSFEQTRDFLKTIYTPRIEPATNEQGMIVNVMCDYGEETELCQDCYDKFVIIFDDFMMKKYKEKE